MLKIYCDRCGREVTQEFQILEASFVTMKNLEVDESSVKSHAFHLCQHCSYILEKEITSKHN